MYKKINTHDNIKSIKNVYYGLPGNFIDIFFITFVYY